MKDPDTGIGETALHFPILGYTSYIQIALKRKDDEGSSTSYRFLSRSAARRRDEPIPIDEMANAPSVPMTGKYVSAMTNEYRAGNMDAKSLTFMLTHPFSRTYLYLLSLILNTMRNEL